MEVLQTIEDLRNRIDFITNWVYNNHAIGILTPTQFKLCSSMLKRTYHCVEMAKDAVDPVAFVPYGEPD